MKDYKKILEGVVNIINTTENSDIGFVNICSYIGENCPELKESEDDRIMKGIIRNLEYLADRAEGFVKDELKERIAWLEKQGEQILANSAKTCKDEQKPTNEEMKTLLRTEYEKGRADAIAEIQNPVDCIDCTNSKGCINCEDGNMKETLVQKPAWSEEDEYILDAIIEHITPDKPFIANGFTDEELVDWLKSLRPQKQWKSSDEQMKALNDINLTGNISYAGQGQVLIELYNDLKKLAEE